MAFLDYLSKNLEYSTSVIIGNSQRILLSPACKQKIWVNMGKTLIIHRYPPIESFCFPGLPKIKICFKVNLECRSISRSKWDAVLFLHGQNGMRLSQSDSKKKDNHHLHLSVNNIDQLEILFPRNSLQICVGSRR